MEIATIEVTGVTARRVSRSTGRWEIPAGLIGGTLQLRFGADWKDLTKTVVFDGCGITKDVVNAGEIVTIPAEVVARPERKLLVGFYGLGEDGTATPTIWLEGYVCAAADPSGNTSTDPALPVWAQLEARIRVLEERNALAGVVWALSNVTSSNQAAQVAYGAAFSAILTAEEGYELSTVTVLMGGGDITKDVWDGGEILIPSVTGDLFIRAEGAAKAAGFVEFYSPMKIGSALNRTGAVVTATENWLCTDFLPAAPGQNFRYTGNTSPYAEYAGVWGYDETGNPIQVLADNGNHLAGVEFTVPEGVFALRCCGYEASGLTLEVRADQADMAGEAALIYDLVVSSTGVESAKAGGGVTDYLVVEEGDLILVCNIVPANGGRFAFYNAGKTFLEAVTIYDQNNKNPGVVGTWDIPAGAAFVRISTNVSENVRAAVMGGVLI